MKFSGFKYKSMKYYFFLLINSWKKKEFVNPHKVQKLKQNNVLK